MAMRLDRKLEFLRKAEVGRTGLNEPVYDDQPVLTVWGSVSSMALDRFELFGISGTEDAREIVVRDGVSVRSLVLRDAVVLDGERFDYVGISERATSRRGFVSIAVSRKT